MRKLAFLIPMFPLVTLAACAPGEVDFAAANAHDIEGLLEVFADDARMLPPNAPPVVGKDAIRDSPAA